jgi:hypothetical protein
MPVVSLLPSWLALFELVEPRAARAVPATFLSKIVAWLSCLVVDCALFQLPISELNTNSKALTFFQGGIAACCPVGWHCLSW